MAKSFDALVKKTTTPALRARAAQRARKLIGGMLLKELREAAGLDQKSLARRLGIKQPSLCKLEGQTNMEIATLQKIVEALGGELDIVARLPEGNVRLTQFASPRKAG